MRKASFRMSTPNTPDTTNTPNAVFHVVTYNLAMIGNMGYSWGVLTTLKDGVYTFYLAQPEERERIAALQKVSGAFLDHFQWSSNWSVSQDEITTENVPQFLTKPVWGNLVCLPEDVLHKLTDPSVIDKVSQYLRRHVSGYDHNKTVYQVPSLDQLEKFDPQNFLLTV